MLPKTVGAWSTGNPIPKSPSKDVLSKSLDSWRASPNVWFTTALPATLQNHIQIDFDLIALGMFFKSIIDVISAKGNFAICFREITLLRK